MCWFLVRIDAISRNKFLPIQLLIVSAIDTLQVYAMVLPDHEINPRVPCKSGVLPRIDLNRWRDASFHSAPSQSFHNGFGKK